MSGRLAFAPFLACLIAGSALADGPAKLLSFAELKGQLDQPNLRILDPRPRADYDKGHIPGAIWVDTKPAQALASKPGGFQDQAAWQKWVDTLGLTDSSRVVICDGAKQLDAARLWWLLGYLGVKDAALVNGNVGLWTREGNPTSTEPARTAAGTFAVNFQQEWLANREDVLGALKSGEFQIVDARSAAEHTGERKMSKRGGHIPDACPLEWSDLVDKEGRFLEESALRSRFKAAGIQPGKPVITHCQGGGRASVDAFVASRLGFQARNYYLGWSDWGNVEDTPVKTGKSDKK